MGLTIFNKASSQTLSLAQIDYVKATYNEKQ